MKTSFARKTFGVPRYFFLLKDFSSGEYISASFEKLIFNLEGSEDLLDRRDFRDGLLKKLRESKFCNIPELSEIFEILSTDAPSADIICKIGKFCISEFKRSRTHPLRLSLDEKRKIISDAKKAAEEGKYFVENFEISEKRDHTCIKESIGEYETFHHKILYNFDNGDCSSDERWGSEFTRHKLISIKKGDTFIKKVFVFEDEARKILFKEKYLEEEGIVTYQIIWDFFGKNTGSEIYTWKK